MDKQDFISKLVMMYPSQFEDETADSWIREYENILEGNYDYNRLWEILISEYPFRKTPVLSWFKEPLSRCRLEEIKSTPIYNTYVDIEITARELYGDNYDTVLRFTATEQDIEKLEAKGKKFKIVSEPYKMGD
jgi:hypothetical protein